ncbi:hypothetical protein [Novosphingobium lentum]|uniref:hypothetical protein n=1 Tax=Novosphingobium lentum TaxID=145287 RepID=UPI0008315227|nr:hypothetical protein [Novosphingobium lentum]
MLLMLGLLALFIVVQYRRLEATTLAYGGVVLGANTEELRSLLGDPQRIERRRWIYDIGGARLYVDFDGSARVASVTCSRDTSTLGSCPYAFGRTVGAKETDLTSRVGHPQIEHATARTKLMIYTGVGFTFLLRDGRIDAIRHTAPRGGAAYWQVFALQALP